MLASLPCSEIITTNYDQLIEKAAESHYNANKVSILPHKPKLHASRWLLKMHGCVTRPSDIVLTREHYIRYAERYAALGGVVQGTLLTKHLLYLGFSLADTNFHRIFESVRTAMPMTSNKSASEEDDMQTSSKLPPWFTPKRGAKQKWAGDMDDGGSLRHRNTAIFIEANELNKELWAEDVSIVTMRTSDERLFRQQLLRHRRIQRRKERREGEGADQDVKESTEKSNDIETHVDLEAKDTDGVLSIASYVGKSGMELLRSMTSGDEDSKTDHREDEEDSEEDDDDNGDEDNEDVEEEDDDLLSQDNKDVEFVREDFGLLVSLKRSESKPVSPQTRNLQRDHFAPDRRYAPPRVRWAVPSS